MSIKFQRRAMKVDSPSATLQFQMLLSLKCCCVCMQMKTGDYSSTADAGNEPRIVSGPDIMTLDN
jgi:hypothetical protein